MEVNDLGRRFELLPSARSLMLLKDFYAIVLRRHSVLGPSVL